MPNDSSNYAALLHERLLETRTQRQALMCAIDNMRETRSLTVTDDEHDPEGSTVSLDQARDAALLVRTEQALSEITAAQERLATGAYGICERCDRSIPPERLQARPAARLCVPCSAKVAGR